MKRPAEVVGIPFKRPIDFMPEMWRGAAEKEAEEQRDAEATTRAAARAAQGDGGDTAPETPTPPPLATGPVKPASEEAESGHSPPK